MLNFEPIDVKKKLFWKWQKIALAIQTIHFCIIMQLLLRNMTNLVNFNN